MKSLTYCSTTQNWTFASKTTVARREIGDALIRHEQDGRHAWLKLAFAIAGAHEEIEFFSFACKHLNSFDWQFVLPTSCNV